MNRKIKFDSIINLYNASKDVYIIIDFLYHKDIDYQRLFVEYIIDRLMKEKNKDNYIIYVEIYLICINYYELNSLYISFFHGSKINKYINKYIIDNY